MTRDSGEAGPAGSMGHGRASQALPVLTSLLQSGFLPAVVPECCAHSPSAASNTAQVSLGVRSRGAPVREQMAFRVRCRLRLAEPRRSDCLC